MNTVETSLNVAILAPTPTPVPTRPVSPTSTADVPFVYSSPTPTPSASPTPLPSPTRTPSAFTFGGATPTQDAFVPLSGDAGRSNLAGQTAAGSGPQPDIFWGAAAAGVIGATMAYALGEQRKRKAEESRQRAEAMEEAARRNAEAEAVKIRNWLAAVAERKKAALLAAKTAVQQVPSDDLEKAERLWLEKKLAEDKQPQPRPLAAVPAVGTRSLPTPRKDKSLTKAQPQPGKGSGVASLAIQGLLDGNEPWWKKVWNKFKSWVTGDSRATAPTSTPTRTLPPPQVFITRGPTATPTPTLTPTIQPTPTIRPTIALKDRPAELKQWTDQAGHSTAEFCGAVLQREAYGAWQNDHWFDGRPDDPGKLFTEAATRWFWSWIKDVGRQGRYHHDPSNPADRELMIYNWIYPAMQSEDNITQPLLDQYFDELNPNFTAVCREILHPTNPKWAEGTSMWSWANAYLYDEEGRKIASERHLYQYGSGCTAWYIFDGPTVADLSSHILSIPDCK
ncbi:MAG: hypothetical protein FD146_969 [Anaerolineaceae bacterium]|nr:MAG: hypothetical protein FD146_969 [Anaerolineaceae bacterium]